MHNMSNMHNRLNMYNMHNMLNMSKYALYVKYAQYAQYVKYDQKKLNWYTKSSAWLCVLSSWTRVSRKQTRRRPWCHSRVLRIWGPPTDAAMQRFQTEDTEEMSC